MAYVPLKIAPTTPPSVQDFLTQKLDRHFLRPVHALLLAPTPPAGEFHGTIANVLLEVVSGISELTRTRGRSGEKFRWLLVQHYPWADEQVTGADVMTCADLIYSSFRNQFVNALGVDGDGNRLTLAGEGFASEEALTAFEESRVRLFGLARTVELTGGGAILRIRELYWGVRRMIESCTGDVAAMAAAEAYLPRTRYW